MYKPHRVHLKAVLDITQQSRFTTVFPVLLLLKQKREATSPSLFLLLLMFKRQADLKKKNSLSKWRANPEQPIDIYLHLSLTRTHTHTNQNNSMRNQAGFHVQHKAMSSVRESVCYQNHVFYQSTAFYKNSKPQPIFFAMFSTKVWGHKHVMWLTTLKSLQLGYGELKSTQTKENESQTVKNKKKHLTSKEKRQYKWILAKERVLCNTVCQGVL